MAFPIAPVNGQQATVNDIVYVYSLATNTWTRTAAGFVNLGASGNISAIGNIIGSNIIGNIVGSVTTAQTVINNAQPNITSVGTLTSVTSSGLITTTGNVSGNYILGDGSQLTNVNANTINTAFSGSANTFYVDFVADDGANNQTVWNSPFLTYVPSSGVLGVSALTATGNITGNYFIGNGSALTSITGANVTGTVGNASFAISTSTANIAYAVSAANVIGTVANAVYAESTGVANVAYAINGANVIGTVANAVYAASAGIANIAYTVSGANVVGTVANAVYAESTGVASVAYAVSGANVIGTVASATTAVTVTSNAQANITSVGTLSSLNSGTVSSSGNVTGANILTGGLITATGNITGNYFIGNGSQLTGITPASSTYTRTSFTATGGQTSFVVTYTVGYVEVFLNGVLLNGADYTATSGTAVVLAAGATAGDILETIAYAVTVINTATNINNGTSNVAVATPNGNVTVGVGGTANVAVFANAGLTVSGLVSATGNITGNYFIGNGSLLTGIAGGSGSGLKWTTVANTAPAGANAGDFWYDSFSSVKYQYTNDGTSNVWVDQSFPTSFSTLAVTGNATIGGNLAVTGTVSYGNIGSPGFVSAAGNVTGGNILTAGSISATGNITGAALTGLSLTVTTGNVTAGNIVNGGANGVGNIGSSTTYFNTVFAKATSAQYADLAEMYCADATYTPGTVIEFGGDQEVTITTTSHSTAVAGIVSTNPSYLMNATLDCENAIEIALVGRVPCQVVGQIRKGDRLVSSNIPGVATALSKDLYEPGCIIGKAMESYDSDRVGTIEVAVGRT